MEEAVNGGVHPITKETLTKYKKLGLVPFFETIQ
jgi:hypothetical protein